MGLPVIDGNGDAAMLAADVEGEGLVPWHVDKAAGALLAQLVAALSASLPLPTGAATQATLAQLLAKVITAPATEAKQDTGNTSLSTIVAVLRGSGFAASGLSYAAEALASSTRSTAFTPIAGRTFYVTLTGTGSATVTLVYSRDAGANFYPEAAGVNGGAPIITGQVAYAGTGIVMSVEVAEVGVQVAVLPGAVSGAITVDFSQ